MLPMKNAHEPVGGQGKPDTQAAGCKHDSPQSELTDA